ncbi:hypothetical protein P3S67_020857 [Capsicum chacoense]
MAEKVDVVFNYGGKWVFTSQLTYLKKMTHLWEGYDPDLLSYIDICSEYTEKLGFSKVKQLLCTGSFGEYYLVEDDAEIRTLQTALSTQSDLIKLQLFAIEEGESIVLALDISQHNEPFPATVDTLTYGESSEEEEDEM